MSWDITLLKIVRYTIGDVNVPYHFSDDEILEAILVATKFVLKDVDFTLDYTVVLGSGGYITPDPTLSNGCNHDAQTLIALRAAALLIDTDARNMATRTGSKAIMGPSFIGTDQGPALRILLEDGPMNAYNKAKWEYQLVSNVNAYRAVINPARLAYASVEQFNNFATCPEFPSTPCITFIDNGDGSGVTATVDCTSAGSDNDVEVSGSWIVVGNRIGNGTVIFYSGVGDYFGRVVSRLNGASGVSDVIPFSILPLPVVSGNCGIIGSGFTSCLGGFLLSGFSDTSGIGAVIADGLVYGSGIVLGSSNIIGSGFTNSIGDVTYGGFSSLIGSGTVGAIGEYQLQVIPNSDENMRAIVNAAHFFWDSGTYPEYTDPSRDAMVVLGIRLRYTQPQEINVCGASGDPFEGLASSQEISLGKIHARDRYHTLYSGYKANHPDTVVGSYVGSYNLKETGWMLATGQIYPPDSDKVDPYIPSCTGEGNPSSAPGSVAGILITDDTCRDFSNLRFIQMGVGQLRNNFTEDVIHFDEVGYTFDFWTPNKIRMSGIKEALIDSGVLTSMNFGGTAFDQTLFFGPDLFDALPTMCHMMTLEFAWNRGNGSDGKSLREKNNTIDIIANYRRVMDSGIALVFIPSIGYSLSNNTHYITSAVESDGGTRILLTLSAAHHIFPDGGSVSERMILSNLPATFTGLENYQWTAEEVIGSPSQVKLYYRFATLSQIKSDLGLGTISFSSGQLHDQQGIVRLMAGFNMMLRRSGDKCFVMQNPASNADLAGSGNPLDDDCWWYWPQQFGTALADYVIDSTGTGGVILQMHRDFTNGTITVYPSGGYVVLS